MAGPRPLAPERLLTDIHAQLAAIADPARAPAMQAYMRSDLPFHGVSAPRVHALVRALGRTVRFRSATEWRRAVRYLWRHARFREERYVVIGLCRAPSSRPFQTPAALSVYAELISRGAWWDYVDEIATHLVGPILRSHPGPTARTLRAWSRSPEMWRRRAAIIAQVGSREATDLDLLADCIAPSIPSREFFLRKAIGWALRQESRYDPRWVVRYVADHAEALSPLSRREALRHIDDVGHPRGS